MTFPDQPDGFCSIEALFEHLHKSYKGAVMTDSLQSNPQPLNHHGTIQIVSSKTNPDGTVSLVVKFPPNYRKPEDSKFIYKPDPVNPDALSVVLREPNEPT